MFSDLHRAIFNSQQSSQGEFPSQPMAPPTNVGTHKVTMMGRHVAPFLQGVEQTSVQLASKVGREALLRQWALLLPAEKVATIKDALKSGHRDIAIFWLNQGVTLTGIFGDVRELSDAVSYRHGARNIHPKCLKMLFNHPCLTDQNRTEIASRLIMNRDNSPALQDCLKSLTNPQLTFGGKTILQHAENIPATSNYGDWDLDDESLTLQQEALTLLTNLVDDSRFAAQVNITSPEEKKQYINQFRGR